MLKFITHRPLWLNILVGVVLAIALFSIILLSLKWLTHHNESRTVPSVTGKSYTEAKKVLEKAGFDVEIQDSIYTDTTQPLTVLKQVPESDEMVKVNRTVYLTINRSVPPMVEMPNLVGYSFRNAEMVLKNMNIRIGDTIYKPDFARNSVLEQRYGGDIVAPGTKLRMGSTISLVLGDGVGNKDFAVPVIIGMTFGEARTLLQSYGIGFAVILPNEDVKDTASAYIYWQNPQRFDDDKKIQHIRSGQTMDVKLQLDKPVPDTSSTPLPQ